MTHSLAGVARIPEAVLERRTVAGITMEKLKLMGGAGTVSWESEEPWVVIRDGSVEVDADLTPAQMRGLADLADELAKECA